MELFYIQVYLVTEQWLEHGVATLRTSPLSYVLDNVFMIDLQASNNRKVYLPPPASIVLSVHYFLHTNGCVQCTSFPPVRPVLFQTHTTALTLWGSILAQMTPAELSGSWAKMASYNFRGYSNLDSGFRPLHRISAPTLDHICGEVFWKNFSFYTIGVIPYIFFPCVPWFYLQQLVLLQFSFSLLLSLRPRSHCRS